MNKTKTALVALLCLTMGYALGYFQQSEQKKKIEKENDFTLVAVASVQSSIILDAVDLIREGGNSEAEYTLVELAKGYLVAYEEFQEDHPEAALKLPPNYKNQYDTISSLKPKLEPVATGQRR